MIARKAAEVTYSQADICIFIFDVSLAAKGIPQSLFSLPPETRVLMFKYDEDPADFNRRGNARFFDEDDTRKGWDFAIHTSDDVGRPEDHLGKLRKVLRRYEGFGLLSQWKQIMTGWTQHVESLDLASARPFARHSYQSRQISSLLKIVDDEIHRASEKVVKSGGFMIIEEEEEVGPMKIAGPSTRTTGRARGPNRVDTVQDPESCRDRVDSSPMSERRRGKRPMGAVDESDEAESSAHAARRARQKQEVT